MSNEKTDDTRLILWKRARASKSTRTVKPGITFPTTLTAEEMTADFLPAGATFDATLEWNDEARTYAITQLVLNSPANVGIGTAMLRKLSLSDLREAVISAAMPIEFHNNYGRKSPEEYAALVTGKLTDDLLREVAIRAAVRQGLHGDPNRGIMENFNVPQRTATHWISRARSRGFLD